MTDRLEAEAQARQRARKRRLKGESRLRMVYALSVRQEGRCALCGEELDEDPSAVHLDHDVPFRITGDAKDRDNLQLTCAACNVRKGAMTELLDDIRPLELEFVTVERRPDGSLALAVSLDWREYAERIARAVGLTVDEWLAELVEAKIRREFRRALRS